MNAAEFLFKAEKIRGRAADLARYMRESAIATATESGCGSLAELKEAMAAKADYMPYPHVDYILAGYAMDLLAISRRPHELADQLIGKMQRDLKEGV